MFYQRGYRVAFLVGLVLVLLFLTGCQRLLSMPTCWDNNDCATGTVCKQGVCVEKTTTKAAVKLTREGSALADADLLTTVGKSAKVAVLQENPQEERGFLATIMENLGFGNDDAESSDASSSSGSSSSSSSDGGSSDEGNAAGQVSSDAAEGGASVGERAQDSDSASDDQSGYGGYLRDKGEDRDNDFDFDKDVVVHQYVPSVPSQVDSQAQANQQAVVGDQQVPLQPPPPECSATVPCRPGFVCDEGTCIGEQVSVPSQQPIPEPILQPPPPECSATVPCQQGFVCDVGKCIQEQVIPPPPPPPPPPSSLNQGLILDLRFESGSTAAVTPDLSGSGNEGTVVGATWNPQGGYNGGGAYAFDGNDYIFIKHTPLLNLGASDFSYSLWFKTTDTRSYQGLFAKNYHPTSPTAAVLFNGKMNIILRKDYPQYAYEFQGSSPVNDGSWHQLAVILEGTTWKYYIDGLLAGTKTVGALDYSNGYNIVIGARMIGDLFFKGMIDDVKVYNYALSSEQVMSAYTVPSQQLPPPECSATVPCQQGFVCDVGKCIQEQVIPPPPPPPPPSSLNQGLILDLRFESGSTAAVTPDLSGSGNEGTVVGATWNFNGGYDGNGAYEFDGNDYIFIKHTPLLNLGTSDFSYSLWFKTTDTRSYQGLFAKNYHPTSPTAAVLFNGKMNLILRKDYPQYAYEFQGSSPVNDGSWHQLAVILEGTTWKYYIDGLLAGTKTVGALDYSNGYNIMIGARTIGDLFFKGIIDDVKVYNYALSSEQVISAYTPAAPAIGAIS